MPNLLQDLRVALRDLRAALLTAAAAVLVVALGTGVNLAVLAVVYGVLLRPLPYPDAERLTILSMAAPDGADFAVTGSEIEDWRQHLRTVEALAGYATAERAVRGRGEPRAVTAAYVTRTFFEVLGGTPPGVAGVARRGRLEAFATTPDVAVLSARLDRQLGSTAATRLTVGTRGVESLAVAAPGFAFPSEQVDVWVRAVPGADQGGDTEVPTRYRMIARSLPGVTVEQLSSDMARALFEIRDIRVGPATGQPVVTPLEDAVIGELRPALTAAAAAAALVLLVTCANVSMLLLGRVVERRRESAIRLALGAGWWQVVRGFLVQSLLLAALGSALGLALAAVALRLFTRLAADSLPRTQTITVDGTILMLSLATVVLVAVLCALAPALQVARRDIVTAFRGGHAAAGSPRRAQAALVIAQIAASIVLLTGAALLAQTVLRLLATDVGVDPARVLAVKLQRGHAGGDADPADAAGFADRVLERLRALPGVRHAGIGSTLPPNVLPFQFWVSWRTETRDDGLRMSAVSATPGFVDALGTRVASGRTFEVTDAGREVTLLSETAARFYDPEQDLASRDLPLRLPPFVRFAGPPRVLGVVADVKYAGLDQPPAAAVYVPWRARPTGTAYLVIRADGAARALAPAVRHILREADPEMPVPPLRTLEDEMARSIVDRRLRVLLALGLAGVALAVAVGGIFALFLHGVAERRREIAIRLALGASGGRVTGLMLRRGLALTGAGAALGVAGSLVLARGLSSLLWGVAPHDPATLAGAVLLVSAASLLAAWLPARRAAGVEPAGLLRAE